MNPPRRPTGRRSKKAQLVLAASLLGVSVAAIAGTVAIYDSFFHRYERPDYALYPGMYSFARYEGSLSRRTMRLASGDAQLAAYYYPAEESRALVVLAHGMHAGADDYLPLIEAMVRGGYSVFAYDATGTYSSGGEDTVGMCQQLVDLDAVLNYLAVEKPYSDMKKVLVGHSWGGYAAGSVLALHDEILACVCIAPMRDGATVMLEKSEQYVEGSSQAVKPIFDVYQSFLFGDYTKYNAIVGINSTDIPVLIAQGVDDTVITPDGQSITAKLSEIENPNVRVYYGKGLQGTHTGIWHSVEAETYVREVQDKLKQLEKKKGEALTDEEKAAFFETVNHRLYSEVNRELVAHMFETFEAGLRR